MLRVLEPFLEDNVAKEIRKDALVIARAAQALRDGVPPPLDATAPLLAAARGIDREFLGRSLPVRIDIRYEAIEPLRARRMRLGLEVATRILAAWRDRHRLRRAFAPGELEGVLRELLQLYAEETEALSASVRLPGLLAPVRRRVSGVLRDAMLQAAVSLTRAAPAASQKG